MTTVLFYVKLIMLLAVLSISTVTDFKNGIVYNILLFPAIVLGLAADIYIWILFPDSLRYFLINIIITVAISLFLYGAHVWAGGDCKLMIAVAFLTPFELYPVFFRGYFCLSASYIWIFSFSYLFLIVDSLKRMRGKSNRVHSEPLSSTFTAQVISWLYFYPVVFLCLQILNMVMGCHGEMSDWTATVIGFLLILILGRLSFLRKWYIAVAALAAGILISQFSGTAMVPIQIVITIPITFLALALRLFIEAFNYETIPTQEVSAGMILSAHTVVLLSGSRVKGLPMLASEDLKARLTQDEAESVRRWEKTKRGHETVTIMRKMPFAIIISLGVMFYLLIGVISNGYPFF